MSNKIYNYPKSSCACYKCTKDKYRKPCGVPTNLGVPGCNFSGYYNCYRTKIFKNQVEPTKKYGLEIINPQIITEQSDPSFDAIDSKTCPNSSCYGTTYSNSDPRLFNAAGGTWLQLDRPPLNSSHSINTLSTDKSLDCYGKNYRTYSDINAGQILYYNSKDREDAYYEPLFSTPADVVGYMYKDPMDNIRPQYTRIPIEKYDPITDSNCDYGSDCLSWMRDSQFQRQDILAKQMAPINEQRWEPRWTNVDNC